jgi:hypothetical protein
MASIITNSLQEQYDRSNKSYKGKIMSGAKERATKQYFKDTAARARRKQGKPNYDTHRREEQPDEEDLWLEDIHFANFLGVKDVVGVPYNNTHIDEAVNIRECDIMCPEPEAENDRLYKNDYLSYDNETICIVDDQSLTGASYFKRSIANEEDDDEPAKKRIKLDEEEGVSEEQEVEIFDAMVAYMKQQVALAQQMFTDNTINEMYVCDCTSCSYCIYN